MTLERSVFWCDIVVVSSTNDWKLLVDLVLENWNGVSEEKEDSTSGTAPKSEGWRPKQILLVTGGVVNNIVHV